MRATRWVTLVIGAAAVSGCAVPESRDDRELLEPLHGPVSPAVLTRQPTAPVIAPPGPVASGPLWRVSAVIDGRTLEIHQGLERVTATIGGIVVPTGDECVAQQATDSLAFITGGGRTFEVIPATPNNGRVDGAMIVSAGGEDLAAVMLSLGLARVGSDLGPERAALFLDIEEAARRAEQGIWSDECSG